MYATVNENQTASAIYRRGQRLLGEMVPRGRIELPTP